METGPLILGIAVVLIVALLVYYMHKVQKNYQNKFTKSFMDLAQQQNLVLEPYEIWNNIYAIGIDKRSNKLFYMKKRQSGDHTQMLDLAGMLKCRVANKIRKIKTSSGSSQVIDRLDLVFINTNPQKPDMSIEFFNGEESLTLRGELPLVEKWEKIVNSCLQSKKHLVK